MTNDAVSYELRLFNGTTNAQIGSTLAGSLLPYQQFRYLDVFAQAGAPAGDLTNVRAEFTNLTAANKKLIGFCTVQENTTFSADFRIAKSYGGTLQNAFVQGGNAFGVTALLGTTDNQPLDVRVNNSRVMRYEPNAISPNVIGRSPANGVTAGVRGATIAGGGVPAGDTDPSFISEAPNQVTDHYGTIGGGFANTAGNGNVALTDAPFATVSGGYANHATNEDSIVGGGAGNTASGYASTVAGGSIRLRRTRRFPHSSERLPNFNAHSKRSR